MIRKAKITDARHIHELIKYYSDKDLMLYRSLNDIYMKISGTFWYLKVSVRRYLVYAHFILGGMG